MSKWLADRLIRAMDRLSYWLLKDRPQALISACDPHKRSVATE